MYWLKQIGYVLLQHYFVGHSFRRTSATLASEAPRVQLLDIKDLGGWTSDTVAQGYLNESVRRKQKNENFVRFNLSGNHSNSLNSKTHQPSSSATISHQAVSHTIDESTVCTSFLNFDDNSLMQLNVDKNFPLTSTSNEPSSLAVNNNNSNNSIVLNEATVCVNSVPSSKPGSSNDVDFHGDLLRRFVNFSNCSINTLHVNINSNNNE